MKYLKNVKWLLVLTVYIQGLFVAPDIHKVAIQLHNVAQHNITIQYQIAMQHNAEQSYNSA